MLGLVGAWRPSIGGYVRVPTVLRPPIWLVLGLAVARVASADWSPEQSELIHLSDAWIDAEVKHDREALERILDERFLATFAKSGKTVDRPTYIARIMAASIEPFTVQNEVVNIHGDTALVISTAGTAKFTWVAVKKHGRWMVISETFSRMTETP